ncbi:MAG: ABC transporter ATP-binding protein [Betaproteobacteria bacterium]|jgi:branched-chain amino acid transport system ATP-binding protein|nr:ABC transporter ATP-binding protein [Betaproteobacteria bacterium]
MTALLEVSDLHVAYGKVEAVRGISLSVPEGGVVAIVGPNGAGKSSLLNALAGALPATGEVRYGGRSLAGVPVEDRVAAGLCLVPERRELFADMTVADNLELGAFLARSQRRDNLAWVLEVFPRLRERLQQKAGTLSGGEQQMLALGRALLSAPRLLMLDEPSLGLAPLIVREIFRVVRQLRARGVSLLIVEQNARVALQVADHAYVIENGSVALSGSAAALASDPRVAAAYLGAT